ncbi:MAG: hypothetical protein ABSB94_18225 [Syntrophorhabdales bacterium]|jgi:hypothetical protein
MSKVTVYYFKGYDIISDQMLRSKRMATLEWIKENPCFGALVETAKEIDTSTLDADGLYREPNEIEAQTPAKEPEPVKEVDSYGQRIKRRFNFDD